MNFFLRILILLGMLGASPLFAQSSNWLWAESGGGLKQDQVSSLAIDSSGEAFLTGFFQDSAIFSDTSIHAKGRHFFVAKYSSFGSIEWVRTSPSPSSSQGISLCLYDNKYLYLSGYFSDSIMFGDTTLFNASSSNTLFLVKYDLSGSVRWAKAEIASGADLRKSVIADRSGNIYLCGSFAGTAHFDGVTLQHSTGSEYYLAKFDSSGTLQWVKGYGSVSVQNVALSITLDRAENIILTGSFGDTVDFGGAKLIAAGTSDVFIAKYDRNGNLLWAKQAGALDIAEGTGIVTDKNDNIYITGSYSGIATSIECVGTGNIGNILIAKYSPQGVLGWMRCDGTGGEENGNGIAIDSNGFLYVTGGYDNTVNFGTGVIPHIGLIDLFLVKLDTAGNAIQTDYAGSSGTDMGSSVEVHRTGNIYISGIFSDTIVFGTHRLISKGITDIFTVKIGSAASVHSEMDQRSSDLKIYPNPANKFITAKIESDETSDDVEVELITLLGTTIKKLKLPSQFLDHSCIIRIPLEGLPKGIYFCRILTSGNIYSGMFVANE